MSKGIRNDNGLPSNYMAHCQRCAKLWPRGRNSKASWLCPECRDLAQTLVIYDRKKRIGTIPANLLHYVR